MLLGGYGVLRLIEEYVIRSVVYIAGRKFYNEVSHLTLVKN
ncbi:hypothetical protein [Streptococcus suis]|nr:hypothetical protein [Streptococcus suis]